MLGFGFFVNALRQSSNYQQRRKVDAEFHAPSCSCMRAGHPTEDIVGAEHRESGEDFQRIATSGMKPGIHWFDTRQASLQKTHDGVSSKRKVDSMPSAPKANASAYILQTVVCFLSFGFIFSDALKAWKIVRRAA